MTLLRIMSVATFLISTAGFCDGAVIISCVGDSITAGVGVSQASVESYPAKLQKLLGTNYAVANCGYSGTTLLTDGDMPYVNNYGSSYFLSRGGRGAPPAIVLIMLGTNDSKQQNWQHGSNFYSDYVALIASYTNLSSHPRILLCTPPPAFNNGVSGINPGIIETNITPLVRELGTNLNLEVIDLSVLLAGHGEWFPDNVHPNSQGTATMAAIIYTALLGDTMNGETPALEVNALPGNKAVLNWPVGGAGWVLQTTPNLNGWTNVSQPPVNNGTTVSVTNAAGGPVALFRLWQPSN